MLSRLTLAALTLSFAACMVGADSTTGSINNRPLDEAPTHDSEEVHACVLEAIENGETEEVEAPPSFTDSAGCNYIGVTAAVNGLIGFNFDICVYSWCESVRHGCLDCAGGRLGYEIHECY